MIDTLRPYLKAVVGFLAPGATTIALAVTEASPGGTLITQAEWINAACVTVITAAGVYVVPNLPKKADGKYEAGRDEPLVE